MALTSMCQWDKGRCNLKTAVGPSTSLWEICTRPYKINSRLPRDKRALLPRSTTAALINREEGRKTSEPTITLTTRVPHSERATPTAPISECSVINELSRIACIHATNKVLGLKLMKGAIIKAVIRIRIMML
jgi:hypothetical protein